MEFRVREMQNETQFVGVVQRILGINMPHMDSRRSAPTREYTKDYLELPNGALRLLW